ncbi:ABC transporter permease [Clostridium tetani]|uniref:ABC transporter permease n=1 Tax=Clostridium tetani TaxID=1513 RepID=A0ABC8ECK3_CLOTA|nr:ABC transporter permease subunit [Clostridium tetani]BDR67080.1 ABC transporter permease [Clostridium tetani]BDR72492.1 ABC transporter permease [Clostridium tetani]BDR80967.1 ABC transporter permease [Clostridium tetani]BDR89424.1 ABC transporter permease [Clostridium tetani]
MLSLMKNEFIKVTWKKKSIFFMIAFILLLSLLTVSGYKSNEEFKRQNTPEAKLEYLKSHKENLIKEKNLTKEKEYIKDFQKDLENINKDILKLEAIIKSNVKEDYWKITTKESIERKEQMLKEDNISNTEKLREKREIERLNILLEKDIPPMEGEFNAFNFIEIVVNEVLGYFLLAVAIVLFFSDIVSGECTPPTLKLLLVQPVSRGKILLSKFLTSTIYSLVFIYLIEFIFFIIVGSISSFGNADYPVFMGTIYKLNPLVSDKSKLLIEVINSTKMIPIWKNTLYLLLHQGLFIVACSAFSLLMSVITKSNIGSLIFGVLSIIITSILTALFKPLAKLSHLFFFTYGPSGDLFSGRLATIATNPNITIGNSIICLVIWTIACYLISYIIFTKEDILI